jgi:hypothetical protein
MIVFFILTIFPTIMLKINCNIENSKYTILNKDTSLKNDSLNTLHDFYKVDTEKIDAEHFQDPKKQNQLIAIMRSFLKKEIRKIKSSMSDQIMEEVN